MRTRRALSVLWLVAAGVAACSAGLPQPTAADASRAKARWPSASLEELDRGRDLYVRKCAGCHALKSPGEIEPGRWEKEVAEMRQDHEVELSDAEASAIVQYLWSVGSRLREEPGRR